jgi:S-DNA-T family DNA segregation ATPase FtsK/SpoIIIE
MNLSEITETVDGVLSARQLDAAAYGPVEVLRGTVRIALRVGPAVRMSALQAAVADINARLGVTGCYVEPVGGAFFLVVPHAERQAIYLDAIMPADAATPRYSMVLGIDEGGALVTARLTNPTAAHMLICGTTGSGKTSLAHTALISLAMRHTRAALGFLVYDPKVRADSALERSIDANLLAPVASDAAEFVKLLRRAVEFMEARTIVADISPRILIYVDELADLIMVGGAEVGALLQRIAQRGREAGVHLLVATQKPTTEAIGSQLKANLPLKIVGRVANASDARLASGINDSGAESLQCAGDFVAVGASVVRFQGALPIYAPSGRSVVVPDPTPLALLEAQIVRLDPWKGRPAEEVSDVTVNPMDVTTWTDAQKIATLAALGISRRAAQRAVFGKETPATFERTKQLWPES